jgi:hypothetical protein
LEPSHGVGDEPLLVPLSSFGFRHDELDQFRPHFLFVAVYPSRRAKPLQRLVKRPGHQGTIL